MNYANAFEIYRNDTVRVKKWVEMFIRQIPCSKQKVLLDCGCGVGRFTVPLSAFFAKTYGVDKNNSMLQIAQQKSNCINWIQADAVNIPLTDNSIDVILASMLIEHLDSIELFFHEVNRLLKPDGILLLRTMLPNDIDNTTWYGLSKRAYQMEMNRTHTLEGLLSYCSKSGLRYHPEKSQLSTIEEVDNGSMTNRIMSRSYEILHHLNKDDFYDLVNNVQKWERLGKRIEYMSSTLLVFSRR